MVSNEPHLAGIFKELWNLQIHPNIERRGYLATQTGVDRLSVATVCAVHRPGSVLPTMRPCKHIAKRGSPRLPREDSVGRLAPREPQEVFIFILISVVQGFL